MTTKLFGGYLIVSFVTYGILCHMIHNLQPTIINSPIAQEECLSALKIGRTTSNEHWEMFVDCTEDLDRYAKHSKSLVCLDEITH